MDSAPKSRRHRKPSTRLQAAADAAEQVATKAVLLELCDRRWRAFTWRLLIKVVAAVGVALEVNDTSAYELALDQLEQQVRNLRIESPGFEGWDCGRCRREAT